MQIAWKALLANSSGDALEYIWKDLDADEDVPAAKRERREESLTQALACAALLHDVGHPPFSHALEPLYDQYLAEDDKKSLIPGFWAKRSEYKGDAFHEVAGHIIVEEILAEVDLKDDLLRTLIERLNHAMADPEGRWTKILYGLIDGEIDVDRLDYLMRDSQRAGSEFGAIDYRRLLDSVELCTPKGGANAENPPFVALGWRGRSAAETLLIQRLQVYRWVLFHPWVVASNLFLLRGLQMLMALERFGESAIGDESAQKVAHLFAELRPNLDYVMRRDPAVSDTLGAQAERLPAPKGRMVTGSSHDWSDEVPRDFQAIFDDGAAIEWLKQGNFLARELLQRNALSGDPEQYAQRLVSYYSTCMHRRKNFFIGWNNYEDYMAVAKDLDEDLRVGIREFWLNLKETDVGGTPSFAKRYREAEQATGPFVQADGDTHRAESGPALPGSMAVQLLNHVAQYAVGENALDFSTTLNTELGPINGKPGFWETMFRSFAAVKEKEKNIRIVDSVKELHSLRESSPIVNALIDAEDKRIKLFTFFVVVPDCELAPGLRGQGSTVMRNLMTNENRKFPQLLLENYKAQQRRHLEGS
ncbi:hypothetical protein [Streptomyces spiramyceticus]|uniref:hypothetical protein n=1 Tax=Streptomyces spiramyceticus TaxID=299717 RepID=UPI0030841AE7